MVIKMAEAVEDLVVAYVGRATIVSRPEIENPIDKLHNRC